MANNEVIIAEVLSVIEVLQKQGLEPVLIGGMALVILGSQRVTHDFDFVVSLSGLDIDKLMGTFYKKGFALVSEVNERQEITRTINNQKRAAARLRLDAPPNAYFFNREKQIRIDLLFDFPFSAKEVLLRSQKIKINSHVIHIASRDDLLRMKEMAWADRKRSTDLQDLEFLRELKK